MKLIYLKLLIIPTAFVLNIWIEKLYEVYLYLHMITITLDILFFFIEFDYYKQASGIF